MSNAPLASLTVGDVMTRRIWAMMETTSLQTAAELFARHHISGAPVLDAQERPTGVITLLDLVDPDRKRSARHGVAACYRVVDGVVQTEHGTAPVGGGVVADVMSPFSLSMPAEKPLRDAVKLMVAEDVHRLLVLDEGKLVGLVTTMDVLRALARDA